MSKVCVPIPFPDLIYLQDFGGDFQAFFDAVYEVFRQDFVLAKPRYHGQPLRLKRYPIVDGRESTFYHITHEGADEANRTPDIRRMERIGYPKCIIDRCPHGHVKVWENVRGRDSRILLFHEDEEYLVVLNKRDGYIVFWTAYLVTQNHSKRKLLREYETYIKTNAAQ